MRSLVVRHYPLVTHASALIVAVVLGVGLDRACAADYPSRTVTIIVPYAAGASTDAQARQIAKGLSERLGKPVVVDNRAGAGGRIAGSVAARAAPDGHTLLFGTLSTLVIEPVLRTSVDYDAQRDFVPITLIAEAPLVLVISSSLPANSIADLIAYARKPSTNLTYATPGPGTVAHLLSEMFITTTRIQAVHVPYKGAAPALTDLLGGQVSMMFTTVQTAGSQIQSGKVRALGVTGSERIAALPQVPTFAEAGLRGLDLQVWYALVAPAKTPADIIARLHKEITAVAKSPEFIRSVKAEGAVVVASSQQDLARRIQSDSNTVRRLIKETNFKLEE
jgi:tripartite-type tricarboxylate transporter receptor subunit TctC